MHRVARMNRVEIPAASSHSRPPKSHLLLLLLLLLLVLPPKPFSLANSVLLLPQNPREKCFSDPPFPPTLRSSHPLLLHPPPPPPPEHSQFPDRPRPSSPGWIAACRTTCSASISQVRNYGTVDYERRPPLKWNALYRRISTMENPALGSGAVLDSWEEERDGRRRLCKWDLWRVVKELRKYRRYKLALQVYNWMASKGDRFTFTSSDMAIQLDLIAKVSGISHAEEHFSNLPDILKDKRTYGALLNVYGRAKMTEKAEVTIELMKNKGYATDALPFNVMMTLYMNVGEHEKANQMIHEMKEKHVKFDVYTYNIWITNCAAMQDADEMERVVGEMISDSSINANWTTYTTLATMHIRLGNFEKAECFA